MPGRLPLPPDLWEPPRELFPGELLVEPSLLPPPEPPGGRRGAPPLPPPPFYLTGVPVPPSPVRPAGPGGPAAALPRMAMEEAAAWVERVHGALRRARVVQVDRELPPLPGDRREGPVPLRGRLYLPAGHTALAAAWAARCTLPGTAATVTAPDLVLVALPDWPDRLGLLHARSGVGFLVGGATAAHLEMAFSLLASVWSWARFRA